MFQGGLSRAQEVRQLFVSGAAKLERQIGISCCALGIRAPCQLEERSRPEIAARKCANLAADISPAAVRRFSGASLVCCAAATLLKRKAPKREDYPEWTNAQVTAATTVHQSI